MDLDTNEHYKFWGSGVMNKQDIQRGDKVVIEKNVNESNGHKFYQFILVSTNSHERKAI